MPEAREHESGQGQEGGRQKGSARRRSGRAEKPARKDDKSSSRQDRPEKPARTHSSQNGPQGHTSRAHQDRTDPRSPQGHTLARTAHKETNQQPSHDNSRHGLPLGTAQNRAFAVTTPSSSGLHTQVPVVRQNENGPCFVIALMNAILLSLFFSPDNDDSPITGDTRLKAETFALRLSNSPHSTISLDEIYAFLMDCLLANENLGSSDIFNTLPMLVSGLPINPFFSNNLVSDFGPCSQDIRYILNHFNLKVYHAFLMPPLLLQDLSENKVHDTFDSCQDYLIKNLDSLSQDHLATEINTFLNENRTEFTQIGYDLLRDTLLENQVSVFFRNDHFNTCIKHNNIIYLLVTDVGYQSQPDIVWMPLSVSDEGEFFNLDFEKSNIQQNPTASKDMSPRQVEQENADLILARQLQMEEEENRIHPVQKGQIKTSKVQKHSATTPSSNLTGAKVAKPSQRQNPTSTPKFNPKPKSSSKSNSNPKSFPKSNSTPKSSPSSKAKTKAKQRSTGSSNSNQGCACIIS